MKRRSFLSAVLVLVAACGVQNMAAQEKVPALAVTTLAQERLAVYEQEDRMEAQAEQLMQKRRLTLNADNGEKEWTKRTVALGDGRSLAEHLGDDIYRVDELVLTGFMPQSDFDTLYDCCFWGRLNVLNMKDCEVEGDSIPANAFNVKAKGLPAQHQGEERTPDSEMFYLEKIVFPEGLKAIGDSAFFRLNTIDLGIYKRALRGPIELPPSLERIGTRAFYCSSVNSGELVIPASVEYVGESCFGKNRFERIVLSSADTEYGDYAFERQAGSLHEIVFPEGITEIACTGLFINSGNLGQFTLPETLLNLGVGTFANCGITHLQLPSQLTEVPFVCFAMNPLQELTLPESLKTIGPGAFFGYPFPSSAEPLYRHLVIPASVENIGYNAFIWSEIEEVELPASLSTIGAGAFAACWRLTTVHASNPVPPTFEPVQDAPDDDRMAYQPVFDLQSTNPFERTLYVPVGAKEAYAADEQWSGFTILEEVPAAIETVSATLADGVATAYDTSGRRVAELSVRNGRMDTSLLRRGLYVVKLSDGTSKKLIVK